MLSLLNYHSYQCVTLSRLRWPLAIVALAYSMKRLDAKIDANGWDFAQMGRSKAESI